MKLEKESQRFSCINHDYDQYVSRSSINSLNEQTANKENDNSEVLPLPEESFINPSEDPKSIHQKMQI